MPAQRVQWLAERNEVTRNEFRALVDELIERVLTVGSGLAPVNRTGLIASLLSVQCDVFAVALHRQLLQVGGESLQVLLVWQYRDGFRTKEIAVPDTQDAHQYGQVALERRSAEVLVHLVKAFQHGPEVFRTDGDHSREPDGRVHGVSPPDPIPEPEHISCVDTEL